MNGSDEDEEKHDEFIDSISLLREEAVNDIEIGDKKGKVV